MLSASPVTAPFSSCDFRDLLSGDVHAGTLLQSKTVQEDSVPSLSDGPGVKVPHGSSDRTDRHHRRQTFQLGIQHIPLRI